MVGPSGASDRRPHVLVIMADQLRWDCLGVAGNPDVKTPHLDRLAADGHWFPQAFCPLPVCTPSRYSLLSGLYVHQHGGWSNRSTLAPELATFPRALRDAGYQTHAVGKMHFTPTYLDVGFDALELAEQNGPGRYDDDYHHDLMAAGLVPYADLVDQEREWRADAPAAYWETFGAARSNLPEAWHSTTWIGDRAVRAIEQWSSGTVGGDGLAGSRRPQLLMASFVKPHHPFDPPAPWDTLYDPGALTLLPGWLPAAPPDDLAYNGGYFPHETLTETALRRVMAHYYATITQLDHQVGRVLAALDRQQLYDDTLIVFTADHGEYLGFHHLLLKSGQMYEPLIKVPLIVKPAGGAAAASPGAGAARPTLVSTVDVAPTILRAAHLAPPRAMAGLDLLDPSVSREFVFAENRHGDAYMARSRRYKLLLNRQAPFSRFYDLREDPYELHSRLEDGAYATEALAHREALARWMLFESPTPVRLDTRAPEVPALPGRVRRDREALRAYFTREMAGDAGRRGAMEYSGRRDAGES